MTIPTIEKQWGEGVFGDLKNFNQLGVEDMIYPLWVKVFGNPQSDKFKMGVSQNMGMYPKMDGL